MTTTIKVVFGPNQSIEITTEDYSNVPEMLDRTTKKFFPASYPASNKY